VDGEQLGVPVGSHIMALVVDRKVLRKAGVEPGTGWTWDKYGKAFLTKGGLGFGRADLTERWTDAYRRVKVGIVTSRRWPSRTGPSPPWPRAAAPRSSPGTTSPSAARRRATASTARPRSRHGRQAHRPVPRLPDAERLRAHPAPRTPRRWPGSSTSWSTTPRSTGSWATTAASSPPPTSTGPSGRPTR
jgi:hypothetical protein